MALANALKVMGLLPSGFNVNVNDAGALARDSSYVSLLNSLLVYFKQSNAPNGFAAAQATSSAIANAFAGNARKLPGGATSYFNAVSAILGDLQLISSSTGSGSIQRDLEYLQAADSTASAVVGFLAQNDTTQLVSTILGKIAAGAGDVLSIIQGFQEGGVLGGLQSGYSADALAEILGAGSALALPIGIAIGLAALFFGGNHDNPADMPDKYDTQNYGTGVANLRGSAGANGRNFVENAQLVSLFSGRTGIQIVEETLAFYGSVQNAPAWLKPMYTKLDSMFGSDPSGLGNLSIGIDGTGKDCNNQRVTDPSAEGLSTQEYQYTQLDAALNEFAAAYAKALAGGQAVALAWDSAADPGSNPPTDTYTSTSYQSADQFYA
jgi:hypothetical protein